jgi:hypothetical protein
MPRPTSSAIAWRKTLLPSKLSHESRDVPENAVELALSSMPRRTIASPHATMAELRHPEDDNLAAHTSLDSPESAASLSRPLRFRSHPA